MLATPAAAGHATAAFSIGARVVSSVRASVTAEGSTVSVAVTGRGATPAVRAAAHEGGPLRVAANGTFAAGGAREVVVTVMADGLAPAAGWAAAR